MKVASFYKQHKMACILWMMFFVSVLIRTCFAGYEKHIVVLHDELYYYSYAQNLAWGRGFPIIYNDIWNYDNRLLYSILISPAFLVASRSAQFVLVALINSIILSVGVFPVYLMARDMMDKRWAVFCAVLYLTLPEMTYAASFMTDILLYSLAVWLIYFSYRLIGLQELSMGQRVGYVLLMGITMLAAVYTKRSSLLIMVVFAVVFVLWQIGEMISKRGMGGKQIFRILIISVVLVLIFWGILHVTGKETSFRDWYNYVDSYYQQGQTEFFRYYFYYLMQCLAACGFLPILLPYVYVRSIGSKGRRLLLLMTGLFFAFTIASNITSLGFGEIARVHMRYIIFLWIPYLILFCRVIQSGIQKSGLFERIGWILVLVISALICCFYYGPAKASLIEYTLLYWAEGWSMHHLRYGAALLVVVIGSLYLLWKNNLRLFAVCFFALWFCLQTYNNVASTESFAKAYKMPDTDIEEVEAFISEHRDDTFVLLDLGDDLYYGYSSGYDGYYKSFNHLESKVADTYLNYENVIRTSIARMIDAEQYVPDHTFYAIGTPMYAYLGCGGGDGYFYVTEDVDYIILPSCCKLDEDGAATLLDVGEGDWYEVYALKDKTKIPDVDCLYYPEQGHNRYSVDSGYFSSTFTDEEGNPVFHTVDGGVGYILYGPYVVLPPGEYYVTVNYRDNTGRPEGTTIGEMDLNSGSNDFSGLERSVPAGTKRTTIHFASEGAVSDFEVRIHTDQPGLEITSIDLYRK